MCPQLPSPRPDQTAMALSQLRIALKPNPNTAPEQALSLLGAVAASDTGQSQAVRHFLFWLVGKPDPSGYQGLGGLELRRLDGSIKEAAFVVLKWWSGPTKSDEPLYRVLRALREQLDKQVRKKS